MSQKLILQLKNGNPKAISLLYDYFPIIKKYIVKNSGSEADAKDVFHEGLLILYKKLYDNNFELNSKVETFIFGICKNIWFEEMRKRTKHHQIVLAHEIVFVEELKKHILEEKKYEKLDVILMQLGEKCKQILIMFYYKKMSMKSISQKLKYKNINTVKTQKYKCLERAKKMATKSFIDLQNKIA